MKSKLLSFIYSYNFRAIQLNVEGVTHEESLVRPTGGGNCMNWILGHILVSRNSILALLGEKPVMAEKSTEPYKRGSEPMKEDTGAVAFEDLLADLRTSQERLTAKLEALSDEELDSRAKPDDKNTLGESLAFLQFHETYHTGQLGVLRRIAGKDGAIK